MKIVFFGAGVIGQSIGGWVASHHDNTYFLDQGEVATRLKEKGITLFQQFKEDKKTHVDVKVISDIDEAADADVIAIGVKNYSLDAVAQLIKDKAGDKPIIIGLQNGVVNQKILPKYFSKVIYCIVGYNAWFEEPGVVGYQKKGPLLFGTINNELQEEMKMVSEIFNKGVETIVVENLQDAAYSKLILNLVNGLTTLIGYGFKEVANFGLFQKVITNVLNEGVQVAKAAGYSECKIGGMPPWLLIQAGAKLPYFLTRPMFKINAKKMVITSMAQDVIQRGSNDTELDTLTGHIVDLADKHNVHIPYNRTVYELCKKELAKPTFEPITIEELWKEIKV